MQHLFLVILTFFATIQAYGFCGFYVAKADSKLFNESSQVILMRDGGRTVLTMSNDFKGSVKDFAIVVPVPVVLQENDIRVVERSLFDRMDAYSAPRLVEYTDQNPCMDYEYNRKMPTRSAPNARGSSNESKAVNKPAYGVTIEAQYTVGEYDILILSATESSGLERWLLDNGYKIPSGAQEVLQPYIRSNLKFFVVKVNLDRLSSSGFSYLRPIQISYESPKFMLPIRLGMANANGNQDLIVYALSRIGRVECTNYRTVQLPTGNEIPTFIKTDNLFSGFYKDLFTKQWQRDGQKVLFLEYGWNVSSNNFQKCDPCVSEPPNFNDLREAGAGSADRLYFTRLHVRYNRAKFPQDLQFQETTNFDNYQARYVVRHPASGSLDCSEGQNYLKKVVDRRVDELKNLADLTGWNISKYKDYITTFANQIKGSYKMPSLNFLQTGSRTVVTDDPVATNGSTKDIIIGDDGNIENLPPTNDSVIAANDPNPAPPEETVSEMEVTETATDNSNKYFIAAVVFGLIWTGILGYWLLRKK